MTKIALSLATALLAVVAAAAEAQNGTPEKGDSEKTSNPTKLFESATPAAPAGELDKIVFAKLAKLKIQPVLCSDAVFVRRAYLDVIGTLPTAQEAREFIQDTNPN